MKAQHRWHPGGGPDTTGASRDPQPSHTMCAGVEPIVAAHDLTAQLGDSTAAPSAPCLRSCQFHPLGSTVQCLGQRQPDLLNLRWSRDKHTFTIWHSLLGNIYCYYLCPSPLREGSPSTMPKHRHYHDDTG